MRNLRTVGFLAVAVTIGIAFGATPAFAKNITLCKENVKECPEKSRYPSGTKIARKLATGTKAVFKSAFVTVECAKSEIEGESENEQGSSLDGVIKVATFGECKSSGGAACTAKALGLWWWWRVFWWNPWWHEEWWEHEFEFSGRPQVELTCSGVTCIYGNEPIGNAPWLGGAPATIDAKELALNKEGGSAFCSSTAIFDATYTVTSPNPVYVTEVT
jgi:hypothetical protein